MVESLTNLLGVFPATWEHYVFHDLNNCLEQIITNVTHHSLVFFHLNVQTLKYKFTPVVLDVHALWLMMMLLNAK